jgi:hypothetical protein
MHHAEMHRCLVQLDLEGAMRLWKHVAPHLCGLDAGQSMIALHMARVEALRIPRRLKLYSTDWLAERGFQKVDGRWVAGPPKTPAGVVEAVGIAVRSNDPTLKKKITTAMEDAVLNCFARGTLEPAMQREAMLKARAKVRFKMRLA